MSNTGWRLAMLALCITFATVNAVHGDTGWTIAWIVVTALNGIAFGIALSDGGAK